MVYYSDENLVIAPMAIEDCKTISEGFAAQGWEKPVAQYEHYLEEQAQGITQIMTAYWQGSAAGYLKLYPQAHSGPFEGKGWPEIVDLNVLEKFQGKGIGSHLLACAEGEAGKLSNTVCLCVGLHSGYGAAQRLYIKRGYIPDGSGLWYNDRQLGQGEPCVNDDDLVLYMSKSLY